ncbi:hypothetical protein JCM5296_004586 [Sporobolomyces johnsonii]
MVSGRRLYIGRVPPQASRRDLEEYFGTHGRLVDVRVMSGFAFLEYDQLRDAEQAVQDFDKKEFMGERLLVEFAKPPRSMVDDRFGGPRYGGPPPPRYGGGYGGGGYDMPPRNPPARAGSGYRLVVSGLRDGTSWQDLKDFARQVGSCSFSDVDRRDPSIGFIEFASRADADEAIRTLSGTELNGGVVTVAEDPDAPPPRSSRYDERPSDRGYSSRDARGDRDDGYARRSTRELYDERDRRAGSSRRSPTPERKRSPSPRRSRSPERERERERERSRTRSPARERSPKYRD